MAKEKIGRNDPCPCGSGRKYKKCHLDREFQSRQTATPQARDPLQRFRTALNRFDHTDLASGVGALQLVPENAGRTIRLESMAEAIASLHRTAGSKSASRSDWSMWLNRGALVSGDVTVLEDPFDNMFTEAITFHAGSYIVFPGITEDAVLIIRQLCKAIFLRPEDVLERAFRTSGFYNNAAQLIFAALSISNAMGLRAGHSHGLESGSRFGGPVLVPDAERFGQLKHAVTFSDADIRGMLRGRSAANTMLSRLIREPSQYATNPDGAPDSYSVCTRPIIHFGNELIVIAPGAILSAIRHAVVCLAQEHHVVEQLGAAYQEAGEDTLHVVLDYSKMVALENPIKVTDPPGIVRSLCQFDSDKLLHVVLLSDRLIDYESKQPFGEWPCNELFKRAAESLQQVEHQLFANMPAPNDILHLIIFNTIGRSFVAGLPNALVPAGEVLMPRLGDVETILFVEPEPLLLWKFARAYREVRDKMQIIQTSLLDEFQAYRKAEHSYYLGDDAQPTATWITGGGSEILRAEVMKRRGFFGAKSARQTGITEVTLLYDDHRIPIYAPWPISRESFELLVRPSGFNIWVTSPSFADIDGRLRGFYTQFVDFVGYWLWQAAPHLEPVVSIIRRAIDQIHIEVRLIPSEHWWKSDSTSDDTQQCTVGNGGNLVLTLGPGTVRMLNRADNAGERELLKILFAGIRTLAESITPGSGQGLDDALLTTIVDDVAPLGAKKKLVVMDVAAVPLISGGEEAPYRAVAEHDESEILDELGKHASTSLSIGIGEVSEAQANRLAHSFVEYVYGELAKTVASIDPGELLEQLVALNETLVQRQADLQFNIPTRMACFAGFDDVTTKIGTELTEVTKALTASRFLIEYVGSRPPRGLRPFSMSVYDRMMALVAALIQWGFNSDILHLALASAFFRMLPSGRVGFRREEFDRATGEFQQERLIADIELSHIRFGDAWVNESTPSRKPSLIERLDDAASAEFGISLSNLETFLGAIMNTCLERNTKVLSIDRAELMTLLTQRLNWEASRLNSAFEFFVTRPRNDFLEPPHPYTEKDIYPWRFGRPLSYLRRSLVLRPGDIVVCGFRNMYLAGGNLIGLILSERMRGESPQFRALISSIRNEFSREFNDEVAALIDESGNGIVRTRVSKIGKRRLRRGNGQDMGDIDVLYVIPEQNRIVVIETKSLETARTPAEMANELNYLFKAKTGQFSGAEKHRERAEWIDQHLTDVLTWLGLDPATEDWQKAEALIVVDREFISDKLVPQIVTAMSLREFKADFLSGPQV